jgi:hypothetical protein
LEWAIIASTALEWEDFCAKYFPPTEWSESGIDRYRFDINWHPPAPKSNLSG